jgi:HPt (histidine-containing phosphotransfer) domain-containing protein
MAYDLGALEAALAAVVGDEPRLMAELRGVFFESASSYLAALRSAESRDDWHAAAERMKGLAASFGARKLMDAAAGAMNGSPSAVSLRRIERAVSALSD